MDAITSLCEKLEKRGDLDWTRRANSILIPAPVEGGFSVALEKSGAEDFTSDPYTVYLGDSGFHIHLASAEEALERIASCFSGETRLVETVRGAVISARLEMLRDGAWEPVEDWARIGLFWRKNTTRQLRNPNLLRF